MKKYNGNVIVSSLQKSGTILLSTIVKELTSAPTVDKYLNEAEKNTSYGGLNQITENKILIYKDIYTDDGSIIGHNKVDISKEINLSKKALYIGHASPKGFATNNILKKVDKKIYGYRYGLDVLNSKMKFIENIDYVYALMSNIKNEVKYQELRYMTPEKVLETLEKWEVYCNDYLKYKDEFHGVKYENLLEYPAFEIKKLADYLDVIISDKEIENIIKKLYFKEIPTAIVNHSYYSHYNKSKKTEEWVQFIPYCFYQKFEERNIQLLEQLNYTSSKVKKYKNTDFHKIFLRKLNIYKEDNYLKDWTHLSANSFLDDLNKYLKGKKVALYGYNTYSNNLFLKLNNEFELIMMCDDKFDEIDNKDVISPKELLHNVAKFDYILVANKEEYQIDMRHNIKNILRLHGGVKVVDVFNKYFNQIQKNKINYKG